MFYMRQILLVDCNNFFVSCEELFNSDLKGKPVCVLSNNDGCIVARSNEAKDLGISMGMPYFIAKRKFKNAIYISGDKKKYSAVSKKIMKLLSDFTPSVEKYSIDEAFLDITGTEKLYKMNPCEIACKIREEIKEKIGIEVSIGVSCTKTLSKIASEIAKKNSRYHLKSAYEGIFEINSENLEEILSSTLIEDVWGVGRNLHKFFRKHNILNALMYTKHDYKFIHRNLGKKGVELQEELKGNLMYPVIDYYVAPKSISRTSSFKEFSQNKDFIVNELNEHLHEACKKLREHNLSAFGLYIMLRRKDFKKDTIKEVFKTPKNSEFEFFKTMHDMFEKIYKENVMYRSSGVCIYRLTNKENAQLTLFEDENVKNLRKLSGILDKIEEKFGYGIVKIGTK